MMDVEYNPEDPIHFGGCALGAFMDKMFPKPDYLWDNFIAKGDFVMITGDTGIGKTLVTTMLTLNLSQKRSFGALDPQYHRRTFYVDAEMSEADFQERISRVKEPITRTSDFYYLNLLGEEKEMDITNPEHQDALLETLETMSIEVLVLDNLFSLSSIKHFNKPEEFIEGLKPLIFKLRRKKITTFLVDHLNKEGKPYGNTAKLVFLDYILKLTKDEEGVYEFEVIKQRRMGVNKKDLTFTINEDNKVEYVDREDLVSPEQFKRWMENNYSRYYPIPSKSKAKAIETMYEVYEKRFNHKPFVSALSFEKNYAKEWNNNAGV